MTDVAGTFRLEQPRTSQTEAALQQMVPGHPSLDPNRGCDVDAMLKTIESIDPNEVESIDWWCNKISDQASKIAQRSIHPPTRLRMQMCPDGTRTSMCVSLLKSPCNGGMGAYGSMRA